MFISRVILFAFKNWKIASRYGFASGVSRPLVLLRVLIIFTCHGMIAFHCPPCLASIFAPVGDPNIYLQIYMQSSLVQTDFYKHLIKDTTYLVTDLHCKNGKSGLSQFLLYSSQCRELLVVFIL